MLTATLDGPSLGECALRGEVTNASARTDDINLARRIRTGDQSAFRELVERYQSRIFRVLCGILNHRDDAQDVAQGDFVNKLLALIPEEDRLLLFWKEVEGCSVAEVAEMTGMNENTIKVRLFRVRQKLVELAGGLSRSPARRPAVFDQDRV